ncbi:methylmalonyl-CoA mutase, C-terminal domain [Desulfacinum hydrothermale DSM 13146]|uniref:Methylmalonyl-CoA mutase, C-terminal domain n=1 Tax=Desulfacinum hydrothermale DSM 13146 TaxID=1121390 RepID=A0A1W1WYS5_9BACT|nr:cobalamin-dependent protein [Desulfacinum hydrothermale]SMC16777.1 methylmalonyl-CoA mutase, C-terminal domain [Desulfacinum hydrothermale DSM 13146]
MSERKVRILMAKFGEGHQEALMRLAGAFSEAGFEVIYTESEDPRAIVNAALQESVDHIGVTTLPGASVEDFRTLFALLKENGAHSVAVTAGGYFDEAAVDQLKQLGLVTFFPKGTTYEELIDWARRNIRRADQEAF